MAEGAWIRAWISAALVTAVLSQTTTIEVPENSAVNLPCKAFGSQGTVTRQEWKFQRDGTTVLFYYGGQFTDAYKDRAVFYPNEIHLKSVTRKDSGLYICEVVGKDSSDFTQSQVDLIVQVPPSKPKAQVPSVVTIGTKAVLTCVETDANPRPVYKWYRDNVEVPADPKTSSLFRNSSYSLDDKTGVLAFEPAMAFDAGDYYCEASNKVGPSQKSDAVRMETSEVNVGGIVAAVVVLLLVLALVILGVWYAYSRGYFSKRKE
ncbi:junctional adhesion molecule A [Anolis sagrei]|uniref:junctional adhesion molecule A n=1 Tax=Anolis sagrei TaxID=38937 RepID=UPI003521595F